MRGLVAIGLGLGLCGSAAADPSGHRGRRDRDLGIIVPVDPYEHERLHWFGRNDHHATPGTVTINRKPFVCDPHDRRFRDRDTFVAHLRADHGIPPDEVSPQVVVVDGIVHYPGPPVDMP